MCSSDLQQVARAKPDGHTLMSSVNTLVMNASLYKNLPYDPVADFVPLGLTAWGSLVLVANPNQKPSTLTEMIEAAKAAPKSLTYGSPGVGTPHHLSMALVETTAGIELLHVPYKGTAGAVQDLLGGQIGYMFLALGVGAWSSAIFHLMTHAFFKALLFLTAGSIILGMHHEQNIFKMGGLRKDLPWSHALFLIGTLGLVAFPGFSGFFSKEEKVNTFEQVMACNVEQFKKYFHLMLNRGVYLAPSAFEAGFVGAAHGDREIGLTLDAAEQAFNTLERS